MTQPVRSPTQLVVMISLLAILGSLLLVPRGSELGYLHLKNNNTEQARHDFEHLYDKGDRSPTTMSSLIFLAQARSDPDLAIAYLKEFIDLHPGDISALRKLLELYREAMQPDNYLQTLSRLQARQPTAARARELEEIYRFSGPESMHAEMLRRLIDKYPAAPPDYLALARYDAARGKLDDALEILDRGEKILRAPPFADAGRLQVTLLLDQNRSAEAAASAVSWSKADAAQPAPDEAFAMDMAEMFSSRGMEEDAARVVEPLTRLPRASDELVMDYVQLLVESKRFDDADAFLNTRRRGHDDQSLTPAYIAVALGRDRLDEAFALARSLPRGDLAPAMIGNLATAAADEHRLDLLPAIADDMDDSFRDQYPLIAAQLAEARGNRAEAAKWLKIAESHDPAELKELTTLEIDLDSPATAYQRLAALAVDPANRDFLEQAAGVFVEKGLAAEALPKFAQMRAGHPGAEYAWAIVAAAASPAAPEVRKWLAAQPDSTLDRPFLETLCNAASLGGDAELRLLAAQRWNAIEPGDDSRFALLTAYAARGDFQSALALLPRVEASGSDLHDFYDLALEAAAKTGGTLRQKSIAFWTEDFQGATEAGEKQTAIEALIELDQDRLILEPLTTLALNDPAQWGNDYADALRRLGLKDQLIAYLVPRSRVSDLTPSDRRDLAYDLLDLNDRSDAIKAFEANAATEGPDSEDLDELKFLWSGTLSQADRDWVEDQVQHAPARDRAAWRELAGGQADDAPEDMQDDSDDAPETPAPAVSRNPAAEQAFRAAGAHRDGGKLLTALASYKAALEADPDNPKIARELGIVEYDLKHFDDAQKHLDLYYASGAADSEADRAYGGILDHQSRKDEADRYFQRALDRIDAKPAPSYDEATMKAELLARLDRPDEARAEYQKLLLAHPGDADLRADYAEFLIDQGDVAAAKQLTEEP